MTGRSTEPHEVERYLHEHIPLSLALGVRVTRLDEEGVRLVAPLEPNLNHRGTGFGGSLSALGVLAGWTLVHAALRREGEEVRLVIQRHEVDFAAAAEGPLEAWAPMAGAGAWAAFLRTVRRRGRGRIDVAGELRSDGRSVGTYLGRYVALRTRAVEDG